MTFEERMAELGVDLSDLPEHERIPILGINRTIFEWKGELLDSEVDLYRYILHLIDIIDRMETRLVNVTGERDWLKSVLENHLFCETCVGGQGIEPCVNGHFCSTDNPNYRYSGVPDDWRADDGCSD